MKKWQYKPLSDFLKERENRFKPDDKAIVNYKRLDKIDFSGQIHISEKTSKTDMILIEPGDLVISGINVAKGALAVYEGDEPITATIHYSSYKFNKDKIDINFLKRFLKSPTFISELQKQVKGGIKTEIKAKHLLSLKVKIPELIEQQKINQHFDASENEISELSKVINTQSILLTKLRQAILQEAIEGKLTAEWRKKNPVRKGDPDYDAEALLEKIKAEKEKLIKEGKNKKQKPLPPIKPEEVPFELPEGWVWTKLGEVIEMIYGKSLTKNQCNKNNKYPVYGSNGVIGFYDKYLTEKNAIIIGRKGSAGALNISYSPSWTTDVAYFVEETEQLNFIYMFYLLKSLKFENFVKGIKPGLNRNEAYNIPFLLPPLAEQQAIVERVDQLLAIVDELEKQVADRKEKAEQLMQAVLREAFEGEYTDD